MSFITLLLVRNGQVFSLCTHYSIIKNLLCSEMQSLHPLVNAAAAKQLGGCLGAIDAGYLVVDLDAHSVIDCQDALNTQRIFPEEDWSIFALQREEPSEEETQHIN